MMMAAATLAVGFAAGLALTVAHTLGAPAPAGVHPDALVLPLVHFWAAALTVPVAAGALLLAAVGLWLVLPPPESMLREHVIPAYPDAGIAEALDDPGTPRHAATARRARRIATDWSCATAGDLGGRLTGAFALWLAAAHHRRPRRLPARPRRRLHPRPLGGQHRRHRSSSASSPPCSTSAARPTAVPASAAPSASSGTSARSGPAPPIRSPRPATPNGPYPTWSAASATSAAPARRRSCSPAIPRAASSAPRSCCN